MNPMINNQGPQIPQQPQMTNEQRQYAQQVMANPAQFLARFGVNVPQNLMGDPMAILRHLRSTGQLNQQQLAVAQKYGIR